MVRVFVPPKSQAVCLLEIGNFNSKLITPNFHIDYVKFELHEGQTEIHVAAMSPPATSAFQTEAVGFQLAIAILEAFHLLQGSSK